jgi:hypothetical protein
MKNIKRILGCLVSGTVLLSSCKKSFTDIPYYGLQTVQNTGVFQTAAGSVNYVTGCYSVINENDWWQTMWLRLNFETATDNGWLGNLSGFSNAASYRAIGSLESITPTAGDVVNLYQFSYLGIGQCNFGISNLATSNIDASLKTRLVAEMRFLRGFFYMDLAKNFGGVPLYTENTKQSEIPLPRATADQVWAFINADLEYAAANLPQRKDYTTPEDKARASKGAALAYLSYANLWSGHYDSSVMAAKALLALNEYQLEPNYGDIYKTAQYNGQESIFEIGANNLIGNVNSVVAGSGADGGWGWHVPSSNLEDAFLNENDSIRRVNTISKDGQPVAGDPAVTSWNGRPTGNTSGRNWRKYYIPLAERSPANQGYNNRWQPKPYIFMRLANVMLIYAEAAARTGDETTAESMLNAVRARVNLAPKNGLSGDALISAIILEKRLELSGEYADVRWDDLHRVKFNGTTMMSSLFGPNGTYVQWLQTNTDPYDSRTNIAEVTANKGKLFKPGTNDLFPIPQQEIQAAGGVIKQNPGY